MKPPERQHYYNGETKGLLGGPFFWILSGVWYQQLKKKKVDFMLQNSSDIELWACGHGSTAPLSARESKEGLEPRV